MQKDEKKVLSRRTYRERQKVHLDLWQFAEEHPYVSVGAIVMALFLAMAHLWVFLGIWFLLVIGVIVYIGYDRNSKRTLRLEVKLTGARKLRLLKAIQLGGSIVMFLAAYMRRIVSINFQSAGAQDSFQILQGFLQTNNQYAQQGSRLLNLLNSFLGNGLFAQYRYATSSAQFMSDASGRWIVIWIFALMIAPAICFLSQFLREPYSRRMSLITSAISVGLFALTPSVIHRLVIQYAINHQMNQAVVSNAFSVGPMAYIAIVCSLIVFTLSLYRCVKHDQF